MTFFLGIHEPAWMPRTNVPLFLSRRRLARRSALPTAAGPWALDSGGFSELNQYGEWRTTAEEYADQARRWKKIGGLDFACVQDWMCEPHILNMTKSTIQEHQARTTNSYIELKTLEPGVPWIPIIQGWHRDDYLRHIDQYQQRGVSLNGTVGIGSVCRRQGTREIQSLLCELSQHLQLHAFGVKTQGLQATHQLLTSADSMAWSYNARKRPPLPGHTHKSCANCLEYALKWRSQLLLSLPLTLRL